MVIDPLATAFTTTKTASTTAAAAAAATATALFFNTDKSRQEALPTPRANAPCPPLSQVRLLYKVRPPCPQLLHPPCTLPIDPRPHLKAVASTGIRARCLLQACKLWHRAPKSSSKLYNITATHTGTTLQKTLGPRPVSDLQSKQ